MLRVGTPPPRMASMLSAPVLMLTVSFLIVIHSFAVTNDPAWSFGRSL